MKPEVFNLIFSQPLFVLSQVFNSQPSRLNFNLHSLIDIVLRLYVGEIGNDLHISAGRKLCFVNVSLLEVEHALHIVLENDCDRIFRAGINNSSESAALIWSLPEQ